MSEPRLELLDSYARELDHDADLIMPPTGASAVRRAGTSRRRRRLVAFIVVLIALAVAVGGMFVANLTSRRAAPNWATTPGIPVTTTPSASAPNGTTTPNSVRSVIAAGDVVTMLGIGELRIGMARSELVTRGVMAGVGGCDANAPAPTLVDEGIFISSASDTVDFILVGSPRHPTQSGVTVGMTMGKVKQVYGDKVAVRTITLQIADPQGNTRQAYVISSGNTLVFMSDSRGAIQSSDLVTSIYLLKGDQSTVPVEIC